MKIWKKYELLTHLLCDNLKARDASASEKSLPPVVTQCWDDQWVINVWPFVVTQGESLATAGYSLFPTKSIFKKQHRISFWKKEDQWVITVWALHLLSESLAPAGSMGGCPTNIQYTGKNSFYKSQQYGFGFVPQLQLYEGYIVGNGGFYMSVLIRNLARFWTVNWRQTPNHIFVIS